MQIPLLSPKWSPKPALLASLLLPAWACGGAGGPEGGGDNLPDRGASGYERVLPYELPDAGPDAAPPADPPPPLVLAPDGDDESLGGPSATLDGSLIVLYGARRQGERSALWRAESGDGGVHFTPTRDVLRPEALGWTQGPLSAPSVVPHDGRLWLAFAAPEGLGLAHSDDEGLTFTPSPQPWLTPEGPDEQGGISSPSLVSHDGQLWLYYTALGAPPDEDTPAPSVIARALVNPDGSLTRQGVVLGAGEGCTTIVGEPVSCWDLGGVKSLEVRVATTGAGRTVWRGMYVGLDSRGKEVGLGFAASWDGATWSRHPFNPILNEGGVEQEPSNLYLDAQYLLFFQDRTARVEGIGLARSLADNPTERF